MRHLVVFILLVASIVKADILEELKEKKELLFDRRNIAVVKQFLPNEIYNSLADSDDVIRVYSELPLPLLSKEVKSFEGNLSDKSNLALPRGLPFNDNSPNSLYWNLQSRLWESPALKGEFLIRSFDSQKERYTVAGTYERVYPSLLDNAPKLPQVFRERLRFTSPKVIQGYSWLSFRFFGDEEDYLLIASPLIKETRILTGSNRSDSLIGGLISLEDLFLLGAKPEYVSVSIQDEENLLLPFVDAYKIEVTYECETLILNKEPERIQKTHPLLKWTPRRAKSVEVTIRDPFHEYGRILLFVDAELLVPTMAQIYDRNGKFKKFIILGNQMSSRSFPVLKSVVSRETFEHFVFKSLSRCESMSLEIFDPRNQLAN